MLRKGGLPALLAVAQRAKTAVRSVTTGRPEQRAANSLFLLGNMTERLLLCSPKVNI